MNENINKLFLEVKKSFSEINSKIKPFNKKSFMWSSPIIGNIYYNKTQFEKTNFSNSALKGVLAHELSHQINYKKIGLIRRLLFKIRYKNFEFRKKAEREADKITIERGFGKNLIQLLEESEKKFEKERFSKIKKTHLSIKEIKELMKDD